jgi:hypothetical protein
MIIPEPRINGWMHVCLMNNGYEIALELHGRLLQSGLYAAADNICVAMVGNAAAGMQTRLIDTVFSRWPKYHVIYQVTDEHVYEWPCLMHMKDNAVGSCFYIHTKGASNECRPDVPPKIQTNIRTWRDCMSHFVIGQWRKCSKIVSHGNYDACGALYDHNEHGKIFAGNYWWGSEHHIRSLEIHTDADGINRNKCEEWITSKPGNFYNLYAAPDKIDYYGFNGDPKSTFWDQGRIKDFGNYWEK